MSTYDQCADILASRLGPWRNAAASPDERAERTARIRHAMGSNGLLYVPQTKLTEARDALHALAMEVGV